MARHTLTIDWQAPTEFGSEGMGQGPTSLSIVEKPGIQRHGSCYNLLNGELFQRTGDATA
jgi:hypothetical protein